MLEGLCMMSLNTCGGLNKMSIKDFNKLCGEGPKSRYVENLYDVDLDQERVTVEGILDGFFKWNEGYKRQNQTSQDHPDFVKAKDTFGSYLDKLVTEQMERVFGGGKGL